jgi:hypothetical protein
MWTKRRTLEALSNEVRRSSPEDVLEMTAKQNRSRVLRFFLVIDEGQEMANIASRRCPVVDRGAKLRRDSTWGSVRNLEAQTVLCPENPHRTPHDPDASVAIPPKSGVSRQGKRHRLFRLSGKLLWLSKLSPLAGGGTLSLPGLHPM